MIVCDELPAKQSPVLDWAAIRVQNELELAPLGRTVNYTADPFASYYCIEGKLSRSFLDCDIKASDFGDLQLIATYGVREPYTATRPTFIPAWYADSESVVDASGSYSIFGDTYGSLEDLGWLKVTYFQNLPRRYSGSFDETEFEYSSPLHRARLELQNWLDSSVDDLADILGLSPTTLINISKPGWTVRPKTVRKMMSVHGLVRELQRALGVHAALTWTRTIGRRLLADGRLLDFEQYVSTHVFPTAPSKRQMLDQFIADDGELELKPSSPIGRPSRI